MSGLGNKEHADVMIVGAGISGIQGALDLATAGFRVYLVDKAASIGGHMAQLDKTFPSNDCSMCIESPKFIECARHPNIEILTFTEVEGVEGEAGDFTVTLTKKPRYIDEEKCTGCGVCVEYCPVEYPDKFNQELALNKAVHIHFAQATPLVSYIDESCLFLKEKKCGICAGVCKAEAIDFNQRPERVEVSVGAVILAAGFSSFDPTPKEDSPDVYGYKSISNVVTSLDYERLLCATGPFDGEVRRPSDGEHPKTVAWLQCVGSRQANSDPCAGGGNPWCSGVCCTYTQKQVILTKEHDEGTGCTVFHNDIRSFGKDFERFYKRAEGLDGVRFIRGYASIVGENPETGDVILRYADPEGGGREEEFEMVVLSVGLAPPEGLDKLAVKTGISLGDHGFKGVEGLNLTHTVRPGVFVSGALQGPMDIPEAVVSASAAGSKCAELLAPRRGGLAVQRSYPVERDVTGEEPRIGVYLCHCGANIGRVVDIPSSVEFALTLPNVIHAEESLFICSTDAAEKLADSIRAKGLNRVVVAACTPRTHEPLFRDTLREAGLNQYYFEMANIREHCSWVHSKEKEKASAKANELIRMAVARAARLEPLEEFELPVLKSALVVGGGVSGMNAALSIAKQGHEVWLVEKEAELGGMARNLSATIEGLEVGDYLSNRIEEVYRTPLIRVCHSAKITESFGYVGDFTTRVESEGRKLEIRHGATIIATGAEQYRPTEHLYGQSERVVTQLELEKLIAAGDENLDGAGSIAMIQCVGCRNEDRGYCARVCCGQAVKNAIALKKAAPSRQIYLFYRDMRTYGFMEERYREAAALGVKFIRFEPEAGPQVTEQGERLSITCPDPVLGAELELEVDLLTLSAGVVPAESTRKIAGLFKLPTGADGFFQEAHVKLRPVDFGAQGVYLCGSAHYPKHLAEAISQGLGAAGRAMTLLANDTVTVSGAVCEVRPEKCIGCGICVEVCTYGAIGLHNEDGAQKAQVNPALCKGDGLCCARCPTGAITLKHYTDEEIIEQLDAACAPPGP